MRLPLPGPQDLLQVLARGAGTFEQLIAAGLRVLGLLADAERLVTRADILVDAIDAIDATRTSADAVVVRTERLARAERDARQDPRDEPKDKVEDQQAAEGRG